MSVDLVSCGPALLYRGGAQPADPAIMAQPDAAAMRAGIGFLETVYEPDAYHWEFTPANIVGDSAFGPVLTEFYQRVGLRPAAAAGLFSIRDAIVSGSVVHCGWQDARPLYETYRHNDRPAVLLRNAEDLAATPPLAALGDRTGFLLASAGSFNYGHWLVDDLPRAKALADIPPQIARDMVILMPGYSEAMNHVREASLRALLAIDQPILFYDPGVPFRVDDLLYVSPVSDHPVMKSPVALAFVADRAATLVVDAAPRTRRLLVVRGASHGRTIANLPEVTAALAPLGFETIDPEALSFEDQVRTFAGAETVVGLMGAAMTNTLFCDPATTILYLAPEDWIETFYWDLAVTRRQTYRVLYCPSTSTEPPPHQRDMIVPIDVLTGFLATA